jgi:hypothetical protein
MNSSKKGPTKKKLTKTQIKARKARELIKNKIKPDADAADAHRMFAIFQEALRAYHSNDFLNAGGRTKEGKLPLGTVSAFRRACQLAKELGVDFETYVRAQFWAFDKWYGTAPQIRQMFSESGENSAVGRVKQYLKTVRQGEHNPDKTIVSRAQPAPRMPVEVVLHKNETVFKEFQKNWKMTAEEVFINFAKTPQEANTYFDKRWLDQNPIYQQLRIDGRIN